MLKKTNENYNATVVDLSNPHELNGLDNLVGYQYFGYQCLVPKSIPVGTKGVFIPSLTSIDPDFLSYFNFFSNKELNTDKTVKGYFPKNGMVKAVKLRGHISNGLFIPLEDIVSFYGEDDYSLNISFNMIGNKTFCFKYEPPKKEKGLLPKKEKMVDRMFIPEHYNTLQYAKYMDKLKDHREVFVSQKLHGTSVIMGYTYTNISVPKWKSFLLKLIGVEPKPKMAYVSSSRRVIKSIDGETKDSVNHFYGSDIWTQCLDRYKHKIPKGFLIYGEILGRIGDSPIQKGYTYNLPKGDWELYVYRVVHIDENATQTELSWNMMEQFCQTYGFKVVPLLFKTTGEEIKKLDLSKYLDKVFKEDYPQAVPLSDRTSVDEGIVIREDRFPISFALKLKSPMFYEYESGLLEKEEEILD